MTNFARVYFQYLFAEQFFVNNSILNILVNYYDFFKRDFPTCYEDACQRQKDN